MIEKKIAMRLRHGAAALVLAAAMAGAQGSTAAAATGPTHITIAQTSTALGWLADYIAVDEGFFKKEGLDVDLQIVGAGDPRTLAALHSGGAQFGAMTAVPALQAVARGEPLRMVSPFVRNFVIQFVINPEAAKKAGITEKMPLKEKYARAKGMTVATLDVGGGLDLMFHVLAKRYGFNADRDYTITAIHSYPGLLEACKRGQVQIALTAIPYGTVGVKQEGLEMFADFWNGAIPEFEGAVHQGMFVLADYAKKHPDTVRRVHDALDEALVFVHKNPEKTVADLQKRYPKLPKSILEAFAVGDANSYPQHAIVDKRGFNIIRDFVANLTPQASKIKYDEIVLPVAQQK